MFATVNQNPATGLVYTLQIMLSPNVKGGGAIASLAEIVDPFCLKGLDASYSLNNYVNVQASAWSKIGKLFQKM
mgnify:CR=1 FL=1